MIIGLKIFSNFTSKSEWAEISVRFNKSILSKNLPRVYQTVRLRVSLAWNTENRVQIQLSYQTKGFGIKIHIPPHFGVGGSPGPLQGPR